jgi:AraC-like DNA-binding protein
VDELIASLREKLLHSGFGAFRDIDLYIRGVVARNALLDERLQRALPVYRERFLQRVLTASDLGRGEIDQRFAELGIRLEGRLYVLALDILNLYELVENGFQLPLLKFSLTGLIDGVIREREMTGYVVNTEDTTIDVIVATRAPKTRVVELARALPDAIEESLGVEVVVSMSDAGADPTQLPRLYRTSLGALRRRVVKGSRLLVAGVDPPRAASVPWQGLEEQAEELQRALLVADMEAALGALKEIFGRAEQSRLSDRGLQNLVVQLYAVVARMLDADGLPEDLTHGQNTLSTLGELKTLPAGQAFFERLAAQVCSRRAQADVGSEAETVRRIEEFIDGRADDPMMSMSMLSDALHLSPSYIYRVLKENTGRTFLQMLTDTRLSRACALLRKNVKVKEVARRVGYSSARYFIRIFKKHMGLTPDRYRKSLP